MTALENATRFFHACESSEGWEACRDYAEPDATFEAQAGPVADWNAYWALTQLGWA